MKDILTESKDLNHNRDHHYTLGGCQNEAMKQAFKEWTGRSSGKAI